MVLIETIKYAIFVQKGQPGVEMDGPLMREEQALGKVQWNEYFFNIENGILFQSPEEIKDGQAKQLVGLVPGCTVSECDAGSNGRRCLLFGLICLQSNMASRSRLATKRSSSLHHAKISSSDGSLL